MGDSRIPNRPAAPVPPPLAVEYARPGVVHYRRPGVLTALGVVALILAGLGLLLNLYLVRAALRVHAMTTPPPSAFPPPPLPAATDPPHQGDYLGPAGLKRPVREALLKAVESKVGLLPDRREMLDRLLAEVGRDLLGISPSSAPELSPADVATITITVSQGNSGPDGTGKLGSVMIAAPGGRATLDNRSAVFTGPTGNRVASVEWDVFVDARGTLAWTARVLDRAIEESQQQTGGQINARQAAVLLRLARQMPPPARLRTRLASPDQVPISEAGVIGGGAGTIRARVGIRDEGGKFGWVLANGAAVFPVADPYTRDPVTGLPQWRPPQRLTWLPVSTGLTRILVIDVYAGAVLAVFLAVAAVSLLFDVPTSRGLLVLYAALKMLASVVAAVAAFAIVAGLSRELSDRNMVPGSPELEPIRLVGRGVLALLVQLAFPVTLLIVLGQEKVRAHFASLGARPLSTWVRPLVMVAVALALMLLIAHVWSSWKAGTAGGSMLGVFSNALAAIVLGVSAAAAWRANRSQPNLRPASVRDNPARASLALSLGSGIVFGVIVSLSASSRAEEPAPKGKESAEAAQLIDKILATTGDAESNRLTDKLIATPGGVVAGWRRINSGALSAGKLEQLLLVMFRVTPLQSTVVRQETDWKDLQAELRRATPLLLDAALGTDDTLGYPAATFLFNLHPDAEVAFGRIAKVLEAKGKGHNYRRRAMMVLRAMNPPTPAAVALAQRLTTDPDPDVANEAVRYVIDNAGIASSAGPNSPPDPVARFRAGVSNPSAMVRRQAVSTAQQAIEEKRGAAAEVLSLVRRAAVSDADREVRLSAIQELAYLAVRTGSGRSPAEPGADADGDAVLLSVLEDPNVPTEIRSNAAHHLSWRCRRENGAAGAAVTSHLTAMLDSPRKETRVAALQAFAHVSETDRIPFARVAELTDDPDSEVVGAALNVAVSKSWPAAGPVVARRMRSLASTSDTAGHRVTFERNAPSPVAPKWPPPPPAVSVMSSAPGTYQPRGSGLPLWLATALVGGFLLTFAVARQRS